MMEKLNGSQGNIKMERRIKEKIDEIVEWINHQEKCKGACKKVLEDAHCGISHDDLEKAVRRNSEVIDEA